MNTGPRLIALLSLMSFICATLAREDTATELSAGMIYLKNHLPNSGIRAEDFTSFAAAVTQAHTTTPPGEGPTDQERAQARAANPNISDAELKSLKRILQIMRQKNIPLPHPPAATGIWPWSWLFG